MINGTLRVELTEERPQETVAWEITAANGSRGRMFKTTQSESGEICLRVRPIPSDAGGPGLLSAYQRLIKVLADEGYQT